jgi:hypothetical protein
MGAGKKLTLIWELTTTFVTFWNICVALEKGCFSCVALKRAVFCKCCYCCLMPVIFAWNSGCWSFSESTWVICVWIFQGKLVSILVVDSRICLFQTSIFSPRILYYFCHSRQLPRYFVVTCYYIGWVNQ